MRNKTLLVVVMAGFLVGACGGDGDDTGETGSPPSTVAPATTAVTPSSPSTTPPSGPGSSLGPAPTATTEAPGPALTLDLRGLGPVRVGMTPAEATAAAGISISASQEAAECTYATVVGGPAGVGFMLVDGRIARVDVRADSPVKTLSGAGIGDTEAEVKALYPGIQSSPHKYVPTGHYLTLVPSSPADQDFRVIFETDGTKVTAFRAGKLPEVGFIEGCS